MNYSKRIVCLANSRKYSGRCIAGKEILANGYGKWIRPVSVRSTGEVSEGERRYQRGREPEVLDIVDIPMMRPAPMLYQTENHVIDAGRPWRKTGELTVQDLGHLLDHPAALWSNGSSAHNGLNDRVSQEEASGFDTSLCLIEPEGLTIGVHVEGAGIGGSFGQRRVRAHFEYSGVPYILAVTDPITERAFLRKANGNYVLAAALICVSLGEPFDDGYCYKLVAAIIGTA
ncbi:MAG TPA: hypothetical protein VNY05_08415 [Candidatus Acidoferrales bacterium]|jgi:hypothetical protein|nr:hypothetical protein [Candidatus Acidoferrales bacterium]